jgi:hypothetical protein
MVGGTLDHVPAAEVVSGERLQALADVVLLPRMLAFRHQGAGSRSAKIIVFASHRDLDERLVDRISSSRTIFIYTDAVPLFQEYVWPRLTGSGYVLMTHNSDHEVGPENVPWIEQAGPRLVAWLAQNLVVEHPKLCPLPIGVANSRWPHGDVNALCRVASEAEREQPSKLVHSAFDPRTHPDRRRAWDAVRTAFPGTRKEPAAGLRYADYLRDLVQHRFSVCPRGNGIDTHRFWECQYLGVVPVVERSTHTERWAREGLAMLLLDDWSELSRERLETAPLDPRGSRPDCLYLSHYSRMIKELTAPTTMA